MEIKRISTICVPAEDVAIDTKMANLFLKSCYNSNYGFQDCGAINLSYSGVSKDIFITNVHNLEYGHIYFEYVDPFKFTYMGRDYFKIQNFTKMINDYMGVICFIDIDTIITKRIELPDSDWDLAFTIRYPWIGAPHYVNLGAWFANVTLENKNRLRWFMQTWLHTPLTGMRNDWSNNYQNYMNDPRLSDHRKGNFEFDRIVSQSVINSFCHYDWMGKDHVYNWDGLKVLILDERYNYPWKYDDPVRDDVYVYHLKGIEQSKTDRAEYLLKEIYK